jgi:hypothetical protein
VHSVVLAIQHYGIHKQKKLSYALKVNKILTMRVYNRVEKVRHADGCLVAWQIENLVG